MFWKLELLCINIGKPKSVGVQPCVSLKLTVALKFKFMDYFIIYYSHDKRRFILHWITDNKANKQKEREFGNKE